MGAKVQVKDRGLNALLKRLDPHGKPAAEVTVGIHETEGGDVEDSGATVLDVADWAEFGTVSAPPRSFVRGWADEAEQANTDKMRKIAQAVVKGDLPSVEVGLDRFGNVAVGDVQKRMVGGIEPPNAPSTIARKGSSTPLIDSGLLKSSVTHQVKS
jgi:hypothetical protein